MWLLWLGGIALGLDAGLTKSHLFALVGATLVLAAIQTWYIWRGAEAAAAATEAAGNEVAPRHERLRYLGYSACIIVVLAMAIVFATYAVVRWAHG